MFSLCRPTDPQIQAYLALQSQQRFSYDFPGETRHVPSRRRGWNVDHARAVLGHGRQCFLRACAAMNAWQMFPSEFAILRAQRPTSGQNVVILYRAALARLWLLFPARVVYVLDETIQKNGVAVHRFGFANGTLDDHPERGEERFLVEWNEADDTVHYDLVAISQPAHWLARLGYPYTRREQARFRRLSCAAMQSACS